MSLFSFLLGEKKKTATVAKERLQIILAHERGGRSKADYLPALQRELIAVISKYVNISPDKVAINVEQRERDNWLVADIPLLRELAQESGGVDDA